MQNLLHTKSWKSVGFKKNVLGYAESNCVFVDISSNILNFKVKERIFELAVWVLGRMILGVPWAFGVLHQKVKV